MNPITHGLIGWLLGEAGGQDHRGRAWVTFAGLAPDLVGSRGPEGKVWPVPYFLPFSETELSWAGQWALNAWPNVVITVLALLLTFRLAWARGYSPVGLLSQRADAAFVAALRGRFGAPSGGP